MNNSPTDLSVVIVSHNHLAVLKNCLTSLYSFGWNVSFEVLVIDNTCTDGTSDWVRHHYSQVRVVQNEIPLGFAANINRGIQSQANSRYVLLLNPDTECLPGMLDELVGFMDCNADVGIAGPMLLNMDGTLQPSCR